MKLTHYNYSIAIKDFVADLISKLKTEGWTETEEGYNTVQPSGYSIHYLIDALAYASIRYADGSSSNGNFTHLTIHMRATYDAVNHRPNTAANGGDARFRFMYGADYTAEAVKVFNVRGWIDDKHCCLVVQPDPTISNVSTWTLYMGEVEAVGAASNTCMLNTPEVLNTVGMGAYEPSYAPWYDESLFIHCLGDGAIYFPMIYGFGASGIDSKIRPGLVYLWRYPNDSKTYASNLSYRIPSEIVRGIYVVGVEAVGDTFTDTDPTPDQTFVRCLAQAGNYYSYCGRFNWNKWGYSIAAASYLVPGELCWIRSA